STSTMSFTALFNSLTNTTASCTVLYIFQLPAMNGILIGPGRSSKSSRSGGSRGSSGQALTWPTRPTRPNAFSFLVRQRDDSGQRAAPEKFEGRTASSGNVRDLIGHSRLFDRRYRVAAADNRRAFDASDCARHRIGAG